MPWLDNSAPKAPYFADAFEKPEGLEDPLVPTMIPRSRRNSMCCTVLTDKEVVNVNDPTKIIAIVQQMPDPVHMDKTYIKGQGYIYIVTALDRMQNESMISDPLRIEIVNGRPRFEFEP